MAMPFLFDHAIYLAKEATYRFDMENARYDLVIWASYQNRWVFNQGTQNLH
jgi:hypothetical protein